MLLAGAAVTWGLNRDGSPHVWGFGGDDWKAGLSWLTDVSGSVSFHVIFPSGLPRRTSYMVTQGKNGTS